VILVEYMAVHPEGDAFSLRGVGGLQPVVGTLMIRMAQASASTGRNPGTLDDSAINTAVTDYQEPRPRRCCLTTST
jgi:hypothetical protein